MITAAIITIGLDPIFDYKPGTDNMEVKGDGANRRLYLSPDPCGIRPDRYPCLLGIL